MYRRSREAAVGRGLRHTSEEASAQCGRTVGVKMRNEARAEGQLQDNPATRECTRLVCVRSRRERRRKLSTSLGSATEEGGPGCCRVTEAFAPVCRASSEVGVGDVNERANVERGQGEQVRESDLLDPVAASLPFVFGASADQVGEG